MATDRYAKAEQAMVDEARRHLQQVQTAGRRLLEEFGPRLNQWVDPRSAALKRLRELGGVV
jgi:hypothetical protein